MIAPGRQMRPCRVYRPALDDEFHIRQLGVVDDTSQVIG